MATINELKEQTITQTPLLLFDCELPTGATERWSTHEVTFGGHSYSARVLRHNLFEMRAGNDDGVDALARVSVTLANADSHFSQIERSTGWKGSKVTVRFVFFDLRQAVAASEAEVLFRGTADAPEEITESTFRLSCSSSLNLQRVMLPSVRVQKRCPWRFPATAEQRAEAVQGGAEGRYSTLYRCGYSADQGAGAGNTIGGQAYTTCARTKADCMSRGMFSTDSASRATARFGGIEYVPSSTLVRSYGERGFHTSNPVSNEARYNDFVPLVYGTAWYSPLTVFAKNDGNLTRMEVLLGMGPIESVLKVVVNGIEIPQGRAGTNMTGTGWFNLVSRGGREGAFNGDFSDAGGNALGDPYGSMALLSVVTPNQVSTGKSLPQIQVLLEGLRLERFGTDGSSLGDAFTNNPAWVLLDVLRRSGWRLADIDLPSFGRAAAQCAELIPAKDLNGNAVEIPRFQCNLVLRNRRSAADVVRGVRNGARLLLTYGLGGKLELHAENTLALEHPAKPATSNSTSALNGGWPCYEFGDGSNGFSGIVRKSNGEPALRIWSRSTAETPNRVSLEFQDAFNEYQQDSLSLTDADDVEISKQEVSLAAPALGVANFDQAGRVARLYLDKFVTGNTYIEFETSVRGIGLKAGDLITVTYLKEGLDRQLFRIVRLAPGMNFRTVTITAQVHQDEWYNDSNTLENSRARRQLGRGSGVPLPLTGNVIDENGAPQFEATERSNGAGDGSAALTLAAGFTVPSKPAVTGLGVPMLSLGAQVDTVGGALNGDQILYYAVTAANASGEESGLSFVVRATIPGGTNTNRVTLTGLSFSSDATAYHVYRGTTPVQLGRVATTQAIAATFVDSGLSAGLRPPPDASYDHANFYWRLEVLPESGATIHSAQTIGNGELAMVTDSFRGMVVRITRGKGAGQERAIASNSATTITAGQSWDVAPDSTSYFVVAESGWRFGAAGASSPVEFEIPARIGATLQVSGRAANTQDQECMMTLSPVTRHRISGAGAVVDEGVPPAPTFGLAPRGRGVIELGAVGFESLANTRTITSGQLTVHYWNELASPSAVKLGAAAGVTDTVLEVTPVGGVTAGSLVQIGGEIVRVEEALSGGQQYRVTRGVEESTAAAHDAQTPLYQLDSKVFLIPFVKDFFGSPACGDFQHSILLPDVRVACVEFFVTNAKGKSPVSKGCFADTLFGGLRTFSGGQFTIQVEGALAIQTNAAPPLVPQAMHSARDIFAVVKEAPQGAPVELRLRRGTSTYCSLTIPAGARYSNTVLGFGLPPLEPGSEMSLDVVSVPQSTASSPGRDLTVSIRL